MSEIALPQDLESAHALILELTAQVHELKGQADDLKHQLDQMARRMYGRRSEQLDEAQLRLAFAALKAELKELAPAAPPTAPPAEKAYGASPSCTRVSTLVGRGARGPDPALVRGIPFEGEVQHTTRRQRL